MEQFSNISCVDLLLVACGFLILQYLQIVLITKYGFTDSEKAESFGHHRMHSYHNSRNRNNTSVSTRRNSYSHSPTGGHTKRRGRRTFGIKHL